MKICQCGCGNSIPVATCNRPKDGLVKGEQSPARFLRGHHLRVLPPPWWKGDAASYRALHTHLGKHYPKSGTCDECGQSGPTDYALIKERVYSRDRTDYRELCRRCHMIYDGVDIGGWAEQRSAAKREQMGAAPACRCGCQQVVEWDTKHSRWRSYQDGHYAGSARLLRKAG